jgi:hypothetical protein
VKDISEIILSSPLEKRIVCDPLAERIDLQCIPSKIFSINMHVILPCQNYLTEAWHVEKIILSDWLITITD